MGVVVEELPEIGLSRISRWCFNCYLISGDNGSLVVVDAGMPTTADDLEPVLERTPGGEGSNGDPWTS